VSTCIYAMSARINAKVKEARVCVSVGNGEIETSLAGVGVCVVMCTTHIGYEIKSGC